MDFNSISKSLQDAIVNVTKGLSEEDNIVAVVDGVRSDRKYNDADHAHNSLSKLVSYQKAKKAELYVNGQKTKHYELNKNYSDFEPKKLSEQSIEQIDELKKSTVASYIQKKFGKMSDEPVSKNQYGYAKKDAKGIRNAGLRMSGIKATQKEEVEDLEEISKDLAGKYLTAPQGKGANKYKVSQDKASYPDYQTMSKHATNVRRALQRSGGQAIYKKPDYYKEDEDQMEEAAVHPMALHVKPVKVGGKTKYKVHAVGSELGGGIKVGEHLTDTHLDDASEMGAKIKHLKESQMVDKTIELHDDFIIDLPSELGFQDYLDAAKGFSQDPSEAILIADSFYKSRDESLVIENFLRSDIESKIKSHEKAGSKVDDTKYSTKNGKPYAEYTVTDSEGRKSRYIHHGSTRRVERE
jgi:hypothetical protein